MTSSGLNPQNIWYNELNRHRLGSEYRLENFGLIQIDWQRADPLIRLQVCGLNGQPVLLQEVPLRALAPGQ